MPPLKLGEIAGIVGASAPREAVAGLEVTGYSIDSRTIRRGELFFALRGEARDGHDFVAAALARSAAGAVVERPVAGLPADSTLLVVPSALGALQALAGTVRSRITLPVVGITGSNGKTTTKEMLAHLLGTRFAVRKSPGNFNNHIGLPLSLLALEPGDQVLVVELGSNHRGEIAALTAIAQPGVGVVTNVGRAHIGLFGSLEAVASEKTDLLRGLLPGGHAVVNADDPVLLAALDGLKTGLVRFGIEAEAEFRARSVEVSSDRCRFTLEGERIELPAGGLHNVYNALAAAAAASTLGITRREVAAAMPGFTPMRMKSTTAGGVTVIDDTYNANPDSMAAALDVLARTPARRRILVMGEMLELGAAAEGLHREVGRRARAAGIDALVAIGPGARYAAEEAVKAGMKAADVSWHETKAGARQGLAELVKPGDVVLVKASRLAGLEEISEYLKSSAVAGRT